MTPPATVADGSPQAAVTFDLDGLARDPFTRPPGQGERDRLHALAFDVVLPRIIGWLGAMDVRATFFAIGADVRRFPQAFTLLASHGHEVASHTFSHPRDFSRLSAAAVRTELERANDAIASATGIPPCGFRAPGYTISSTTIRVLTELGFAYDASVVPSWSYSMLKHLFRAIGRREFRDYLVPQEYACARAPRLPYRIGPADLFAASPEAPLVEIPVTAIGWAQFPYIHGLSSRLPAPGRAILERILRRRRFFSLSFHDLEFAERLDYGALPASGMTERHLRTPIATRLADLTALVGRVKQTHRFLPLRDVAATALAAAGQVRA
jgi:peptidoglycan/xylan/chitin deacetylase (PgdA/CDA1 family)